MPFQIALGARIRKSPFFDRTVEAGVTHFTTYNHMYMPVSYGDPAAEYDRLVNGVAMWDVAVERQVSLKGPDAVALARLLTPRNLDALEEGMGMYVPMTNSLGTLINDPVLQLVGGDEVWLSIADSDMKYWAEGVAVASGMDVAVGEPDASPLAVQGPKAVDVVADLFGGWVREMRYFGFRGAEVDGIPVILARSGWSKQGGFEIYLLDGGRGGDLWDRVAEAGGPHGIGPGAPNTTERVESGLISIGTDTDDLSNPFEMGLGKYVDLGQEAGVIGKEALAAIARKGPKRRFCGLFVDGGPIGAPNTHRWPVEMDGGYAGFASAAAWSPRLERNIATALVAAEAADGDRGLVVRAEAGDRAATATSLPFIGPGTVSTTSPTPRKEARQ